MNRCKPVESDRHLVSQRGPHRRSVRGIFVLTIWLVSVAVVTGDSSPRLADRDDEASMSAGERTNPHGSPDGCRACHRPAQGTPRRIPLRETDDLCLSCHDGVSGKREGHPIRRDFRSDQVQLPKGWPTLHGRLLCLTCHDVLPGCRSEADPGVPYLLRGGTDGSPAAFCARCHIDDRRHARLNPHDMRRPDGTVACDSCRYCHSEDLDCAVVTQRERVDSAKLTADEFSICLGCHSTHVDYYDRGHINARVPDDMLNRLRAFERDYRARLGTRPESASPAPLLPLAEGNRVTCTTCHNPHEQGLFRADADWARGGVRSDTSRGVLSFRGLEKDICFACHDK
jgi:predicted CXXCH cytochrome family protein